MVNKETNFNHISDTSWLFDPFGNKSTYGVEFKIGEGFSWDFYLFTRSIDKAEELGYALLMSLRERFKGLDGKVSTDPIYSKYLELERPLYEIVIPSSPIEKIHFLRKLINYYKSPDRELDLNMFILWKKDDLNVMAPIHRYMIKFFISLYPNKERYMDIQRVRSLYKAILQYLISDMSIPPHIQSSFKLVPPTRWKEVLTCKIFPTKAQYGIGRYSSMPRELLPHYIEPTKIDFTIPQDIPLKIPPILNSRNLDTSSNLLDPANYLFFGKKLIDGVLSNEKAILEIDWLNTHLNIFGKSGNGKSTLIKLLINELNLKRPDVGVLIINLVKPNLEHQYSMAKLYKFPCENFKVPYILVSSRVKKAISGSSNVLAACLGLKYVGPILISETFQRCYSEFEDFPLNITEFFKCVESNLKAKPYDPDTQKTILVAFIRRIEELFSNHELKNTLQFNREIPEWFLQWRKGDTIIIDLTECDNKEQHLLTMLIFQMIETLTPFNRLNEFKHLITIDEAHRVIGKAKDNDPESVEFIMKNRINALFSNTIEECRSKGLGILIAEQKPHLLLDSAIDSAAIKILFGLGYPSNELFTGDLEDRETLLNLKSRYALMINGRSSERYLCRIIDDNGLN